MSKRLCKIHVVVAYDDEEYGSPDDVVDYVADTLETYLNIGNVDLSSIENRSRIVAK